MFIAKTQNDTVYTCKRGSPNQEFKEVHPETNTWMMCLLKMHSQASAVIFIQVQ